MLRIGACLAAIVFAFPAAAKPLDYFTPENVTYDAAVPTPESVIGHELGEKPVRHDMMVRFLRAAAEASDRLSIETIGYSHEGRPIEFLVATAPENHDRLEEIRRQHRALADPDAEDPPVDDLPVVTWLNYGVHGAESAGMDAAIPAVYHLAAAQDEGTERALRESVILITAIFNPDGHSRRINHVYSFLSEVPVTDPAHAAHDLWMAARTNHYWFDLNRQWLLQTQPESKAWLAKWHHWKPNVTVDYHEMGSNATYYFHPGVPERKNPLIPNRSRELASEIAGFHANFLDRDGKLYYSEETFDNFYIGKGSTYPQVNGSIGILFEAGAARGGKIDTPNGVRTYADNIRIHFRTSLTSIEGARANRMELLSYQKRFFDEAPERAGDDDRRAFVFTSPDRARLTHFLDLLDRHDVEAYALAEDVESGDTVYRAGEAYIVPTNQAQYTMIRGLFDRVRAFEAEIFYDVSGWTMPLAYDLDYTALTGRAFDSDLLGDPARAEQTSAEAPPETDYGYVFGWEDYYAPRALYRLLGEDVIARAATRPFTARTESGEVAFGRGAIFVPLARQTVSQARIHEIVSTIAEEDGIPVHSVTSGHTPTAGADFGGRQSFTPLEKPKVVVLFEDGIRRYDAGEVWHLLDFRMNIPVVLRRKNERDGLDLTDYTHLVLPGGRGAALSKKQSKHVKGWVKMHGGTVIALRQGAEWAEETLLSRKTDDENGEQDDDEAAEEEEPARYDYASFQEREAEHIIGGTIFGSDLDITHPLGFGYRDRLLPSHRDTTLTLQRPEDPYATVAEYRDEQPVLSGYASDKRQEEIAGTPMTVAERLGDGSVILIADNPNFRATFLGTSKLFLNGLFFSKAFSAARGTAEE